MAQPNNTSFSNTPQAKDDFFSSSSTGLTDTNLAIAFLDVMGNDLGGNAKSLWSIDNGAEATTALEQSALLAQDTGRTEAVSADHSANGARIWITADGKIGYDASTLNASFRDQLDHLTAGQYLNDTFTYAIRLGNGTLSWATATVQIAGANHTNHAAVIGDPTVHDVTEDVSVNGAGNLTAAGTISISDPDAGQASFQTTVGSANGNLGSLVLAANGNYTYTVSNAAVQYLGTLDTKVDTFTITSADGTQKQVSFTIHGVNDAPVAANDAYSTNEDTALVVAGPGVLGNDTDIDSPNLTAALVSGPAHGTLALNANGSFTYTPDANYNGTDSFSYKANDGSLNSNTATVSLTISAVNDAPVASDDAYATDEDTALVVAGPGVLGNDSDVDSPSITAALVSGPAHGTLALNANGSFTYTPEANYNGTDSFSYKANDGSLDSNVATVSLTINAVNDAPVAQGDTQTVGEDRIITPNLPTATDVDGTIASYTLDSGPAAGHLTFHAEGWYTFDARGYFDDLPDGGSRDVSFTYHATDNSGADSAPQTVTIHVTGENDRPSANLLVNGSFESTTREVWEGGAWSPLGGSTEMPGWTVTGVGIDYVVAPYWDASDGIASLDLSGTAFNSNFVYAGGVTQTFATTPGTEYVLQFDLSGNPYFQQTETVEVTVAGQDQFFSFNTAGHSYHDMGYAPQELRFTATDTSTTLKFASNDGPFDFVGPVIDNVVVTEVKSYSSTEDTPLTIAAPGLLAGFSDAEHSAVSAALAGANGGAQHGTVTANADGSFTYTPFANFNGTDTFGYVADDGSANSNVAYVNLTINPVNDAPVASDDAYSTNEDTPLVVAGPGVLGNDSDLDSSNLSAILVQDPAHGSLALNADGSFTYTPDANYNGGDSFSYKANDGLADSNLATVNLTINPVNDPPVAHDDSYGTSEDTPLIVSAPAGVLANDTDVDHDPLSAILVSGPAHGNLTLNSDGTFTYTPDANYNGADGFSYRASDGHADYAFTTVDDGAQTSRLNGINNSGQVIGYYFDGSINRGFSYLNGVYTPVDVQGAHAVQYGSGTIPDAINNSGEIVGDFWGASDNFYGVSEAFTDVGGTLAELNALSGGAPGVPPSYQTAAKDVNDSGQVVGYYAGSGGDGHGFLYSNSQYIELTYNGVATPPQAINNSGDAVGSIYDYGINHRHGFLYSGGNYTTPSVFDAPGAADTYPSAINESGEIAGFYSDSSGHDHGFTYQNGQYTILDAPGALNTDVSYNPNALNNSGAVVGSYEDAAHNTHGFVYSNGVFTTLDDPLATTGTYLTGINDSGEIVGYYSDATGDHGFIANANANPGSTVTVTLTINPVNDPASISGTPMGSVTEDGTLTAGATLTVSDVDTGENHFQTPSAAALAGTYGTFTFDPNSGVWGYTLNNAAANVQALIGTDVKHDKLTVTSVDGTAQQDIDVTVHGTYDVSYVADGTVDLSATKASSGHPNEIINGSGIPSNHFGLANVTDAGIQLGMQIIYRQGPTVTTSDDYGDGVLHFTVNEGPQSTANGSSDNNAARAAWSFDYSIATGLNGQPRNLSNYAFKLLADVDPSAATSYHTFEMVGPGAPNATGFVWIDDSVSASGAGTLNGHPIVIADDGGNAHVAQNSENYSFGFLQNYLTSAYGTANNFAGSAHFDLVLQAYDNTSTLVAQNHIVVDVNHNQPPETNATSASGATNAAIPVVLSGMDSDGTVAGFRISNPPLNGTLYSDAAGTMPLDTSHDVAASAGTATVYFKANFAGAGSFSYAAVDNNGAVDLTPATASITVTAPNQAPFAFPDFYSVGEASSLVHTHLNVDAAHGVLQNDMDPDGGPSAKTAVLVNGPTHGTLTLNPDGSFGYAPDPDYLSYTSSGTPGTFNFNYNGPVGPDTFTYRAFDGQDYSAPTQVSITVNPPPELLVNPWNYDMQHGHDPVSEPMGGLYDDLSGNGSGLTFTQGFLPPGASQTLPISAQAAFTVAAGGVTYWVSGQNFTYDANNVPTGGTISGIEILNQAVLSDSNALPQTTLQITSAGSSPVPAWNVDAGDFVHALQSYSASDDRSGLDAIFQNVRYETIEAPPLGNPTEVIMGGQFADDLRGAGGHGTIYGGPGDDRLAGNTDGAQLYGQSGADTFEFGGQGGHQYINDFSGVTGGEHDVVDVRAIFSGSITFDGSGHIQLDANGYRAHSFADVMSRASQGGADTILNFDFGQLNPTIITLKDTNIANLQPDDFLYANYDPMANFDSPSTIDNHTAINIDVLANDFDTDADMLSIVGVFNGAGQPALSALSADGASISVVGGHVYYDPNVATFAAVSPFDSFSYKVSDGHGGFAVTSVSVHFDNLV